MINALMYKTDCQWRMLPKEFGLWQTVYFYFRKWKLEGLFEELMHLLRDVVRTARGKAISPSVGLIDSRSVRTAHHIDSTKYRSDGDKKGKERKEHRIVDKLGLLMGVKVHAANVSPCHNPFAAVTRCKKTKRGCPNLKIEAASSL